MKIAAMFPGTYLRATELTGDTTLTIKGARMEDIKGHDGTSESKPVLHFVESVIPDHPAKLVLNKTNANMITEVLDSDESSKWKGKQVTLYPTKVEYGNKGLVPAIRVRPADYTATDSQGDTIDDDFTDDIPF